jgi:bacterial/archaeal transporter family protein
MNWIVWALLSAFFAALTALLAKEGVAHVDSNLATAVRTTVVLVIAWLVAIGFGGIHEISSLNRRTLIFLCASGVATGLSWLCYFRALALGPVSKVAPLDKLSVVFVLVLAWAVLKEPITAGKLAGGALITAGAVVLAIAR